MGIATSIDELHIYPHSVSSFLHAAFEYRGRAEFASHRFQVVRLAFVFRRGRARDNFQVADTSKFGKDFILGTVGEISVPLVFAEIREGKHCDPIKRNAHGRSDKSHMRPAHTQKPNPEQPKQKNRRNSSESKAGGSSRLP